MTGPTATEASVSPDRYDEMLRLADLFEATGEDLRARARLGVEVLGDEDVSDSEPLSRTTYATAADDIRAATTGKHGALNRSIELDDLKKMKTEFESAARDVEQQARAVRQDALVARDLGGREHRGDVLAQPRSDGRVELVDRRR